MLDLKYKTIKNCSVAFRDKKETFKTAEDVDIFESTLMEENKVQ